MRLRIPERGKTHGREAVIVEFTCFDTHTRTILRYLLFLVATFSDCKNQLVAAFIRGHWTACCHPSPVFRRACVRLGISAVFVDLLFVIIVRLEWRPSIPLEVLENRNECEDDLPSPLHPHGLLSRPGKLDAQFHHHNGI